LDENGPRGFERGKKTDELRKKKKDGLKTKDQQESTYRAWWRYQHASKKGIHRGKKRKLERRKRICLKISSKSSNRIAKNQIGSGGSDKMTIKAEAVWVRGSKEGVLGET